jgi:phosphate uptake regulator
MAPWRRNVQETGGGSLAVTLPKSWASVQGLGKGSQVLMVVNDDGSLTLLPERGEAKRNAACMVIKANPTIVRDVVAGYLLGYDILRLESSEPFSRETIAGIRSAVRRLSGAEIVEELPRMIEVQVLLNPEVVAPEKVLRRQGTLVESMVADASTSLLNGDIHLAGAVAERDEEVDRQYFILVRMVRSAIRDPDICRRVGIRPLRLLDIRLVAKFLEDSGDQAVAIAARVGEIRGLNRRVIDHLSGLGASVLDLVRKSTCSFLSADPSLAADVPKLFQETRDIVHLIDGSLGSEDTDSRVAVSKVIPRLERIAENSMDIVELTSSVKPSSP